jgi:Arc/MetJ family transcription regulator
MAKAEIAAHRQTQRTTVQLDMALVQRAQKALGTKTIRETIDEALREVDRRDALRRGAEMIDEGGLNLATPEDLAQLRRPQD